MIEKGFGHAYMYGEPRNANSKRYRMLPKCCQLSLEKRGGLTRCAHDWPVKFELPVGDPSTGQAVFDRGGRPETGTYEGGMFEMVQGNDHRMATRGLL